MTVPIFFGVNILKIRSRDVAGNTSDFAEAIISPEEQVAQLEVAASAFIPKPPCRLKARVCLVNPKQSKSDKESGNYSWWSNISGTPGIPEYQIYLINPYSKYSGAKFPCQSRYCWHPCSSKHT